MGAASGPDAAPWHHLLPRTPCVRVYTAGTAFASSDLLASPRRPSMRPRPAVTRQMRGARSAGPGH